MMDILSAEAEPLLREAARERMLLAFDFDGTLAPIVEDRNAARMRDSTRRLLRLVALFYPCAVISGRSRPDLLCRVDGIPLLAVVGNHGAEAGHGPVDRAVRTLVVTWKGAVEAMLRGVKGVEIEDKHFSLAIHHRHVTPSDQQLVEAACRSLEGARIFGGLSVVNVVPPREHDKGEALARVLSRIGRRGALYVGDDVTDEDAFRSEAVTIAIRIGSAPDSAARYFLGSQGGVDDLLRALVRARRHLDGLDGPVESLERLVDS